MPYVNGMSFGDRERREAWQAAFPGMDLSVLETPLRLRDLPIGPEVRATSPPPTEQIENWVSEKLQDWGVDGRRAANIGAGAATALGFTPLGLPMAVGDTAHALVHGEYAKAGLAALPLVAGGLLGKAIMREFQRIPKTLDNNPTGMANFSRYAEEYPKNGPPRLFDKATLGEIPFGSADEAQALVDQGKAFWRKNLPPETVEFATARRAIQRDLEKNGFDPYFNPMLRADVDPRNYPSTIDLSQTMPKRVATAERIREHYRTNGSVDRLIEAYRRGKALADSSNWSALKQIEDLFIREYGPTAGLERFKKDFVDPIAATTAGNSPRANFLMAHYVALLNKAGHRMPEETYKLPYPIGGRYARSNLRAIQKYLDEGSVGFDAANPKRHFFSRAMFGDRDGHVIDERVSRAIDPRMRSPRYYGLATEVMDEAQRRVGAKDAREFGDAVWAGLGHDRDISLIQEINEAIERTHRLTGMSREEIVRRGLIRKEIPLYGIAGGLFAPMVINANESSADGASPGRQKPIGMPDDAL